MFRIEWSIHAQKQLGKLPRSLGKRIYQKVTELKGNPYRNVKRLTGVPFYRLRVGDFRIILDIQKARLVVIVIELGSRKRGYR